MAIYESSKENYLHIISIWVISALVSLSAVFILYVHYFQSYGLSVKRIAILMAAVVILASIGFWLFRRVTDRFLTGDGNAFRKFGFWLLVALILSPMFFPIPHYPVSPLFRASSKVTVTVSFPGGGNDPVQLKGVWLEFDDKKYSSSDFTFSDEWSRVSDRMFLDANSQGEMTWEGKVGYVTALKIFPMDTKAHIDIVWDGEESTAELTDTPLVIKKKSATPVFYYMLIVLAQWLVMGYGLFVFFSIFQSIENPKLKGVVVAFLLASLSVWTVYIQFQNPEIHGRMEMLMDRHMAVINGLAPGHWQYRVLPEWLIEWLVPVAGLFGFADPYFIVFVLLRLGQNGSIYFLTYSYYKKSGFSEFFSMVGIIFVTGSLLNSFHQSDLSFSTYFDVLFYLVGVLILMADAFKWLPLLMFFAALNRETSGIIPLMALSFVNVSNWRTQKTKFLVAAVCLFLWGAAYFGLREVFPERPAWAPYGNEAGIPLLLYNLRPESLSIVFRFFSVIPLLGIAVYRNWHPLLKRYFFILVPVWVVIHLLIGVIAESRLFLVPQILVFIPSALVFFRLLWERRVQKVGFV